MNAKQRQFLVDKLQANIKAQVEGLKSERLAYPSIDNYLFRAVLNDTLAIQPAEVILSALKKKAMAAKAGENWLSDQRMGVYKHTTVRLDIRDLVVLPEDYKAELERVKKTNEEINGKIAELMAYLNTIETRIQLASDAVLQRVINEVDDMGDVRLIDTTIKMLNKPQ